MHLPNHPQSLDNSAVEIDEFGFRHLTQINIHRFLSSQRSRIALSAILCSRAILCLCLRRRSADLSLSPQQITEGLFHDLPTHFGNGLGQRDIFGTDLDTVLRIAAFLDAAIAHQSREPFPLQRSARGIGVKQPHLGNSRGANEARDPGARIKLPPK